MTWPPTLRRPPEPRSTLDGVGESLWRDWRVGAAATVAAAALYGLGAGMWTPRGPVTTSQALFAIAISLLVGCLAGFALRSRWAMVLAPSVFAAVFDVVRVGASGATVDGIYLQSTYGVVAFVLGRGVHGVLVFVPMLLGVAVGAASARRLDNGVQVRHGWARAAGWGRRVSTAFVIVGLVAAAIVIARPADTDAIVGADGMPMQGSVAELGEVSVGGKDLALMIRGESVDNPVLLFLAGGPGGTELGAMRRHGGALEEDFVVATLDQRGTGKSYDALDPTSSLTVAGAVTDVIDVTNYLREKFHQDKIYLVGNSWGTILGVLAAQEHPELYRAFIGTGQMVSPLATDLVFYRDTLAWARRTGKGALVDELTASGPPPYTDMLDYETALTHEKDVYPYDHTPNSEGAGQMSENLFVEEYSLMEQVHSLGAVLDVFTVLYPQLQEIDFRTDATRLEVPVYLVEGAFEAPGRARIAEEWFQLLDAPKKSMVVFDTSGHRPLFEQPDQFHRLMTETVLRET